MNILLGADPELFASREGQYISGWGMIAGDKQNPFKVQDGAVQVDGMALEFNIDPTDTEDGFIFNLQSVMNQLRSMVEPDIQIVADPVARFTPEYIAAQPEEARELGCDPDYNAWTSSVNPKPDCLLPIRTGAGHVHIGFTEGADIRSPEHIQMCEALIRQLDFYLGLPSLLFDTNVERRSMYGCAGAYRPKSYGCEYRVLSNVWLRDEKLMRWVFQNTTKAVQSMHNGQLAEQFGDIQDVINRSDVVAAKQIIEEAGIPVPEYEHGL